VKRRLGLLLRVALSSCLPVAVAAVSARAVPPWSGILDPSREIDWPNAGFTIPNYTAPCATQPTLLSGSGNGPYTVTISPGVYFNNIRSSQSPGAWWPGFVQNASAAADSPLEGNENPNSSRNNWAK